MLDPGRFRAVSGAQQLVASCGREEAAVGVPDPGSTQAWDGGKEIPLGGPKPRAPLAVLLLQTNRDTIHLLNYGFRRGGGCR
jgi:hypothetical protein